MAQVQGDNSGSNVILGILVAVLLAVGAYYFLKKEGAMAPENNTTNIEMPDVNVEQPAPTPTPAPADGVAP